MDVVEHLTLCENILNESFNDTKKRLIKSFQEKNETFVLQVSTGDEDYTFSFKLIPKQDENFQHLINTGEVNEAFYYNEDDNFFVEIKDIALKGYSSIDFQEMDISHLKSVLKTLAHQYSRQLKDNNCDKLFSRSQFSEENFNSFLHSLSELIAEMNHKDIDKHLLIEGIKTLVCTREIPLKVNEDNVYIRGNIFRKRVFFKIKENQSVKCKILNTRPGKLLPLVYDVLLVVLYFTDQKTRQQKFHEIMEYFYIMLDQDLRKFGLDITTMLPLPKYHMQIKIFSPYVKLDIAHHYYQQFCSNCASESQVRKQAYKNLLFTSLCELNECVLYPSLTREDCFKVLNNIIGSCDYKFLGYKLLPVEEPIGFMGDYFKLKINIARNGHEDTIHLFAKYVPTANGMIREVALSLFKKEEFIYNIFVPKLVRLGLEDIVDFSPKCYFVRTSDVLIFEDMSELNYISVDSKEPLSYKLMRVAVEKLAKLHACSLLYEEILSKELRITVRINEQYIEYMQERFFQEDEEGKKFIQSGINAVTRYVLGEYPDIPNKFTMKEFKDKSKLLFNSMFERVKKSEKYRNVICHGDVWSANVLFKMNSDKEPINCSFIDYQLIRYCPPAHDLLCLFYINTDRDTRREHMLELIDKYYAELSTVLRKYDCDITTVFPYDAFIDSCNYMKSQSICQASLYYQTSLCPDIIESLMSNREKFDYFCLVDREDIIKEMMKRDLFKVRFKEIVQDLNAICESA